MTKIINGETNLNKREIGSQYEDMAVQYLEQNGFTVLERNYRNRKGEIDIIGRHQDYLVFAEVKYRHTPSKGSPEEAVGFYKQRTICKVADYYRMLHEIGEFSPVRYDVLAIYGSDITWHQNAFSHIY